MKEKFSSVVLTTLGLPVKAPGAATADTDAAGQQAVLGQIFSLYPGPGA